MWKNRLMLFAAFLIGLSNAWAQESEILPFYPTTANVTNRLIPFMIKSKNRIVSVEVESKNDCIGFVDFFYYHIFHVYCYEPATVSAKIFTKDKDKKGNKYVLGPIEIVKERVPTEPVPTPTATTDETGLTE